jgi:hypothetical protein
MISLLYLHYFAVIFCDKINKILDFTENRGAKENMKNATRTKK